MTNIACDDRREIDLLAVNPKTLEKYHIEVTGKTRKNHSLRERDLDNFYKRKFEHPKVKEKTREIFGDSNYGKVLVVWNAQDNFAELPKLAKEKYGIEVLGLRHMIRKFMQERITIGSRDDFSRVMELVFLVLKEEKDFRTIQNKHFEEIRHAER